MVHRAESTNKSWRHKLTGIRPSMISHFHDMIIHACPEPTTASKRKVCCSSPALRHRALQTKMGDCSAHHKHAKEHCPVLFLPLISPSQARSACKGLF